MTSALYNQEILRLATSIPCLGRLEGPGGTADKRSPTCGSRVIADVRIGEDARVTALGLDVRACALGQASAALLGANALGRSAAELREAATALRAYLTGAGEAAEPDFWPGMAVLAPARDYPARHPSILLAFEAASEAAESALAAQRQKA
ncbi:MAG: iron-sulfur cluster assembly scaffold protein [Sphingobium sp.]